MDLQIIQDKIWSVTNFPNMITNKQVEALISYSAKHFCLAYPGDTLAPLTPRERTSTEGVPKKKRRNSLSSPEQQQLCPVFYPKELRPFPLFK